MGLLDRGKRLVVDMVVGGTGTGDIDTAAISMSNQHATGVGRRVQGRRSRGGFGRLEKIRRVVGHADVGERQTGMRDGPVWIMRGRGC